MSLEFGVSGAFNMAQLGYGGARNALLAAGNKIGQAGVRQAKINASGRPGPNVDTGRFRASINDGGGAKWNGSDIVIIIGSNVDYAPVLENGFSGSVNVKSFTRMQSMAFGRSITPVSVTVKSHSRKMSRKAFPSLKPAVDAPFMTAVYANILSQEIANYWASGAK